MATNTSIKPSGKERNDGPVNEPDFLNTHKGQPLGARIKGWMFTLDHKRIGMMYLFGILISLIVGGFFALLVRTELFLNRLSPFSRALAPYLLSSLLLIAAYFWSLARRNGAASAPPRQPAARPAPAGPARRPPGTAHSG